MGGTFAARVVDGSGRLCPVIWGVVLPVNGNLVWLPSGDGPSSHSIPASGGDPDGMGLLCLFPAFTALEMGLLRFDLIKK
jgi:hypothetical protein